jgi:quercetin dioxygenase-like cupin family protein
VPVVRGGEERRGGADGNRYAGVATPLLGARELVVARAAKDPGARSVPHSHDREEVVHVLSGRAVARVGDVEHELGPGDTLIVPPGLVHQVSTLGEEPFECVLAKPAGIRFFAADGGELDLPQWMM